MLSDRNYMRNPQSNNQFSSKPVFIIIAINIFIFMIGMTGLELDSKLTNPLALVTSMFQHANFSHLLFNMWSLYLFGTAITPPLSGNKFLKVYFISGISGGILWLLFNWGAATTTLYGIIPHSVIGASGAVFGIMMACAMLKPNMEILLIICPVPIKMKTLALVLLVFEIFSQLSVNDNIANLAHLGGFIAAYIYLKLTYKGEMWDPLKNVTKEIEEKTKNKSVHKDWTIVGGDKDKVSQVELNFLLDKISSHGINSLTEAETDRLKLAREQING